MDESDGAELSVSVFSPYSNCNPTKKKNVCGALVWTGARVREELPGAPPKK